MSKARKKINLATAKVADGALKPVRSVYEVCGIATTDYQHKDLGSYSKWLNTLNLIELQDHAYKVGTLAGPDRATLIDRLEGRFIRDHSRFQVGLDQPAKIENNDLRAEAERVVSRGR